ncbi:hypothetical protein SASPL_109503 [Salvia splendens]|uniref:Uncharacterized protein n=1 Tax=Salvia splendens TaxID=180675 RepID=A0A8X8YH89_SALSN|nr:hypothetical protein SASPL_109503 [Salvia splendens]
MSTRRRAGEERLYYSPPAMRRRQQEQAELKSASSLPERKGSVSDSYLDWFLEHTTPVVAAQHFARTFFRHELDFASDLPVASDLILILPELDWLMKMISSWRVSILSSSKKKDSTMGILSVATGFTQKRKRSVIPQDSETSYFRQFTRFRRILAVEIEDSD